MKAQGLTKETIGLVGVKDRGFPEFNIGDTIAVTQRIKEGNKERDQIFQGDVIAIHTNGVSSTFTVRKIGAHSVAVERILPFQSPNVKAIKVVRRGDVRRAKLYYIRDRVGKAARVKEKVVTRAQAAQSKKDHKQQEEASASSEE